MKKIISSLFLTLVLIFFSNFAGAEEDSPGTVESKDKPTVEYKSGFIVRTPDDEFNLSISGGAHVWHYWESVENGQDTNTFKIRRATLIFSGTVFKMLNVTTIFQASTGSDFTYVSGITSTTDPTTGFITSTTAATKKEQKLMTYWQTVGKLTIAPEFILEAGQLYLPFDRMGETSSGSRLFVEVPITATQKDGITTGTTSTIARNSLGTDFDLGLRMSGAMQKFDYFVGIVNGAGGYSLNGNNEFNYGARLVYNILGKVGYAESDLGWSDNLQFAIGAGTVFEDENATDPNTSTPLNWIWNGTADIGLKWRGLAINSAIYTRKLKTGLGYSLDDFGYYAHIGYFVIPKKVELGARMAQIFREGPDNNSNEFGGVATWYIKGNNLKLQTDYTNVLDYENITGTNNETIHRVRTALIMKF